MKIKIKRMEMENAFRSHKQAWETFENNSYPNTIDCCDSEHCDKMVLFYAVECGLKALLMKKKDIENSETEFVLKNETWSVSKFNHNINEIRSKLKIKPNIPKVSRDGDGNKFEKPIEALDLHHAWRYGAVLDKDEEKQCIESLKKILDQIASQI